MHIFSRQIWAVTGIGLGVAILAMVWSIANTALSSIQKDLSASVLQLQWMMNCFGILLCVPLLTMGKLGDAYGRKRLFLWGLIGALVSSVIAGFANHIGVLIACMGLFGLSGSAILPLSQALLVHQFPESQKEKAVGLWSIFASMSIAHFYSCFRDYAGTHLGMEFLLHIGSICVELYEYLRICCS
ncbi:MAG: MFS transporter [Ignavibacteriae bacterium]|nr:MFS transporter [Ignavibacteriota bacterium]